MSKTRLVKWAAWAAHSKRGWLFTLFLFLVVATTLTTGLGLQVQTAAGGSYSLAFLILLYVNLFLLFALGFLVVRNLSRLWLDRRQQRAGSRLRTRMVAMFVAMSLVPTVVVAILSLELLNRGVDSWFSDRITQSLANSLEVARSYYQESQRTIRHDAEDIARNRTITSSVALQDRDATTAVLELERLARGLDEIVIQRSNGTRISKSGDLPPDPLPDLTTLRDGSTRALLVSNDTGTRVRAFVYLGGDVYLSTGRWIDRQIISQMEVIEAAYVDYNQLRAAHVLLKNSHALTLVLITLLLLLAAMWSGFRMAGQITDPITELVEGTRKVAAGDLSVTLLVTGDDELATLQAAFNAMTQKLTENQRDLQSTNALLKERRRFMAAILRNISSAVISVNRFDEITLINPVAGELLGVDLATAIGRPYTETLPGELLEPVRTLLKNATLKNVTLSSERTSGPGSEGGNMLSTQIQIQGPESHLILLTRLTMLENRQEEGSGFILTFDDLTDVLQAQRTRTWSDVARRIAHEIKNPLTPIQLWAQRMRRKYLQEPGQERRDWRILDEGTQVIISQVEELRVLVNEFSNFARMPRPDLKNDDLNATIREVLTLYDTELRSIDFKSEFMEGLSPFPYDRGQIKQVVTNLIANALAAIGERREKEGVAPGERREKEGVGNELGRLVISTSLTQNGQWARVVVADNGVGILPEDRSRVWEPYFTTKKKGTGLGLAIVKKIIEDHGGTLRLRESPWQGVQVEFQLPISGPASVSTFPAPPV
ncbi:MAG: HAMP domain-containing protein [Magnetococcales bacterium]|nr:HAMP domain-containing protein [Magnetococcales bacterium]